MSGLKERKVYGYVLKNEELRAVTLRSDADFLCLLASNPFPGYPQKVNKQYYYLLLDPRSRMGSEEELLRITSDINQSYRCNIDATPCELSLYNKIHSGLRLYNPAEKTIPDIVGHYRRYGVNFLSAREVKQFTSLIKVHKYFDLEESMEGICKSKTFAGFYYVKMPGKLEWEEFNQLVSAIRNEGAYNTCDFAMAVFRTNNSIEDYIRIFTDNCTEERQLAFREFVIETVKTLTLK